MNAIRCWFFDLDNTLYPPSAGIMPLLSVRIGDYIRDRLHVSSAMVEQVRVQYCGGNGSCLTRLRRDFALQNFLRGLHTPKYIFTNGPAEYARRVLETLDIADEFMRIFDIRFLDFVGKPVPRAYCHLLQALNAHGAECVLIEDSVRNLRPAKTLGMTTILMGTRAGHAEWVDVAVQNWRQMSVQFGLRALSHAEQTHTVSAEKSERPRVPVALAPISQDQRRPL